MYLRTISSVVSLSPLPRLFLGLLGRHKQVVSLNRVEFHQHGFPLRKFVDHLPRVSPKDSKRGNHRVGREHSAGEESAEVFQDASVPHNAVHADLHARADSDSSDDRVPPHDDVVPDSQRHMQRLALGPVHAGVNEDVLLEVHISAESERREFSTQNHSLRDDGASSQRDVLRAEQQGVPPYAIPRRRRDEVASRVDHRRLQRSGEEAGEGRVRLRWRRYNFDSPALHARSPPLSLLPQAISLAPSFQTASPSVSLLPQLLSLPSHFQTASPSVSLLPQLLSLPSRFQTASPSVSLLPQLLSLPSHFQTASPSVSLLP
ncbi:hypothetical protein TGDOM2_399860, partial [Toxoplasma gondii GAB2-2007-GAL-DOM2]